MAGNNNPICKGRFEGDVKSFEALSTHLPDLSSTVDSGGVWLWGPSLTLDPSEDFRQQLNAFARRANALLALADPNLSSIRSSGAVEIHQDGRRDVVCLLEGVGLEVTTGTMTLSARGGGPEPRPIAARIPELCAREPRFERASNLLAECGLDMVKLYMVVELIEFAHGNFPPKKRPVERADFCKRIEILESEWEALHRTARPDRHAEPYHDDGPTMTARQARYLIQHALKLWLEREVPH